MAIHCKQNHLAVQQANIAYISKYLILKSSSAPAGSSSVPSSLSSDSSSSPREWNVCGILDFGDVTVGFLFLDLAIAMSYLLIRCPQGLSLIHI